MPTTRASSGQTRNIKHNNHWFGRSGSCGQADRSQALLASLDLKYFSGDMKDGSLEPYTGSRGHKRTLR